MLFPYQQGYLLGVIFSQIRTEPPLETQKHWTEDVPISRQVVVKPEGGSGQGELVLHNPFNAVTKRCEDKVFYDPTNSPKHQQLWRNNNIISLRFIVSCYGLDLFE